MPEIQEFQLMGQTWFLLSEVLESVDRGADYLNPMFVARIPSSMRARLRRPGWPWVVNEEGAQQAIERPWLQPTPGEAAPLTGLSAYRADIASKHRELVQALREEIATVDSLPTTGVLAERHGVMHTAMAAALRVLRDEKLIKASTTPRGWAVLRCLS